MNNVCSEGDDDIVVKNKGKAGDLSRPVPHRSNRFYYEEDKRCSYRHNNSAYGSSDKAEVLYVPHRRYANCNSNRYCYNQDKRRIRNNIAKSASATSGYSGCERVFTITQTSLSSSLHSSYSVPLNVSPCFCCSSGGLINRRESATAMSVSPCVCGCSGGQNNRTKSTSAMSASTCVCGCSCGRNNRIKSTTAMSASTCVCGCSSGRNNRTKSTTAMSVLLCVCGCSSGRNNMRKNTPAMSVSACGCSGSPNNRVENIKEVSPCLCSCSSGRNSKIESTKAMSSSPCLCSCSEDSNNTFESETTKAVSPRASVSSGGPNDRVESITAIPSTSYSFSFSSPQRSCSRSRTSSPPSFPNEDDLSSQCRPQGHCELILLSGNQDQPKNDHTCVNGREILKQEESRLQRQRNEALELAVTDTYCKSSTKDVTDYGDKYRNYGSAELEEEGICRSDLTKIDTFDKFDNGVDEFYDKTDDKLDKVDKDNKVDRFNTIDEVDKIATICKFEKSDGVDKADKMDNDSDNKFNDEVEMGEKVDKADKFDDNVDKVDDKVDEVDHVDESDDKFDDKVDKIDYCNDKVDNKMDQVYEKVNKSDKSSNKFDNDDNFNNVDHIDQICEKANIVEDEVKIDQNVEKADDKNDKIDKFAKVEKIDKVDNTEIDEVCKLDKVEISHKDNTYEETITCKNDRSSVTGHDVEQISEMTKEHNRKTTRDVRSFSPTDRETQNDSHRSNTNNTNNINTETFFVNQSSLSSHNKTLHTVGSIPHESSTHNHKVAHKVHLSRRFHHRHSHVHTILDKAPTPQQHSRVHQPTNDYHNKRHTLNANTNVSKVSIPTKTQIPGMHVHEAISKTDPNIANPKIKVKNRNKSKLLSNPSPRHGPVGAAFTSGYNLRQPSCSRRMKNKYMDNSNELNDKDSTGLRTGCRNWKCIERKKRHRVAWLDLDGRTGVPERRDKAKSQRFRKVSRTLMFLALFCTILNFPGVAFILYISSLSENRTQAIFENVGVLASTFFYLRSAGAPLVYAWRFINWRLIIRRISAMVVCHRY